MSKSAVIGNDIDAIYAMTLGTYSAECIGEGCSRSAYLINDIVYKVGCAEDNENEVEWAKFLRDLVLPDGWAIPKVGSVFEADEYGQQSVIAMEYVPGVKLEAFGVECWWECHENWLCKALGYCIAEDLRDLSDVTKLTDVHTGNFILAGFADKEEVLDFLSRGHTFKDITKIIIDLGESL